MAQHDAGVYDMCQTTWIVSKDKFSCGINFLKDIDNSPSV